MNQVILLGRITKDIEVKQTPSGLAVCSFTVAVQRKIKNSQGQRETDFITCVAWRQLATTISTYFHKGSRIGIIGQIQTRSYDDQNGQKRYVTEVLVDGIEFVDTKADTQQAPAPAPAPAPMQDFVPVPQIPDANATAEVDESNLPFDLMGF